MGFFRNLFKSPVVKLIEGLEKQGWKNLSGVSDGSGAYQPSEHHNTLRPPDEHSMLTFKLGVGINDEGQVVVQIPNRDAYAPRCTVTALMDLIEAMGVKLVEYEVTE